MLLQMPQFYHLFLQYIVRLRILSSNIFESFFKVEFRVNLGRIETCHVFRTNSIVNQPSNISNPEI